MDTSSDVRDSTSAASSTDDAFNSADARIHFGPFRSPEKKLAASLDELSATSPPLRRSPRHSNIVPKSSVLNSDDEEPENDTSDDVTRQGTPDNEGLVQDEPSSVLASRIMRAHDNPSPPPQSPEDTFLPLGRTNRTRNSLGPDSLSIQSVREYSGDSISDRGPGPPPLPSLESIPLDSAMDGPATMFGAQNPSQEPDSILAGPPANVDSESAGTPTPVLDTEPQSDSDIFSIIDSIEERDVAESLLSPAVSDPNSPVDEVPATVESGLIIEDAQINSAAKQDIETTILSSEGMSLVQTETQTQPSTPLRRSSRPRRSVVSYASPLRDVTPTESLQRSKSPVRRRPRKSGRQEVLQSDNPLVDGDREPSQQSLPGQPVVREEEQNEASGQRPSKPGHQKLDSLSPHSVKLLGSLVPTPKEPEPSVAVAEPTENAPERGNLISGTSSQPAPPPPIRFPSPKRISRPNSPHKYRLQVSDASSTPAQRILISEAVSRGQLSAQKGTQLNAQPIVGTSRTPLFKIPATDTPARRIALPQPSFPNSPSKSSSIKLGALGPPIRVLFPERSKSVEPKTSETPVRLKQRSGSLEPASNISWRTEQKLPFPLVPENGPIGSIPEEVEQDSPSPLQEIPPAPSPSKPPSATKSRFKQSTSRIPRRTIKPYARPISTTADSSKAKGMAKTPVRMAKADSPPTPSLPAGSKSVQARVASTSISGTKADTSGSSTSLKRKRSAFEQTSSARPAPSIAVPPLWKVSSSSKPLTSPSKPLSSLQSFRSPVKNQALENLRLVPEKKSTSLPNPSPSSSSAERIADENKDTVGTDADLLSAPVQLPSLVISSSPQPEPKVTRPASPPVDYRSRLGEGPEGASSEPASASEAGEEHETVCLRRTSRVRKPVVGLSSGSTSRSTQPRRRKPPVPQYLGTGPFAIMNAVDLRQLTSTNTTRNQEYLTATLETEIIRKEGPRPESPGIKAKTVSQKEQEEKEKEQKARAERRARRSKKKLGEDMTNGEDDAGSDANSDEDKEDDAWDPIESSPSARRHTRGAGEDEDYETPRRIKRLRLDDHENEVGGGRNSLNGKRRVQWDRGLFTEVYLDEVQPRPRQTIVAAAKGCLAPTAKALKLDDLGNLPNSESPLKDLVQENIIVKRFVYDNDVTEEPAPTPTPVVKNTRSKKNKS